MIRSLALLLLTATLAISPAPAAAESIQVDLEWVEPPGPTDYDMVEEADRIVLVRAASIVGEQVRFKVEEVVKGQTVKGAWLDARAEAEEGSRYLVFLTRDGEEWIYSDLGFLEITAGDEDWVRVLSLFAGIAALDDEELETKALRELREDALANPGRYPAVLLVRMIDKHFGTPTRDKPFADLMDLYYAAVTDRERLAVLWALQCGDHPETAAFFSSLLLSGERLWMMRPVLEWMRFTNDEVPLLKDLVRVWLGHPWEDRTHLLELMLEIAGPEDAELLWSLLPEANLNEKLKLVGQVLPVPEPAPWVHRLRLPADEPLTADLFLLWIRGKTFRQTLASLEELLRRDRSPEVRSLASLEELLLAFEASREPAVRLEILMEVHRRLDSEDQTLAALWRLLRQASPREAEIVLQEVCSEVSDEKKLAALYRAASGEEEKNRALWFLFAAEGEIGPLLAAVGALGEGSVRLERVARAFLTCPSEEVRHHVLVQLVEMAAPGDFLTMVKVLEGASLAEARTLAPWFARHPGPEVLSHLWRLPILSLYEEHALAEVLAAAGDPEVLDMALDLRRQLTTDHDRWAYRILARSPLPAAQEEARCLLEDEGRPWQHLLWEVAGAGNVAPWHEWFLQEIASSETVAKIYRELALTSLERLSSEASPEP